MPGSRLSNAREQSGFIGITQSANLFVKPSTSQGLRPVDTDKLPADLRTRPSTSLAFEFLDQPFLLDLGVESSPPLVRADSKTLFRIDPDRARSETTIELDWVRGQLSELELGVAAGLQLISVGPPEVVESSHLSDEIVARGPGGPNRPARTAQDSSDAARSRLEQGDSRAHGPPADLQPRARVKLGLFTPVQATSVSASYALVADRGLALELEDDSGRIRRFSDPAVVARRSQDGLAVDSSARGAEPDTLAAGGRRQFRLSADPDRAPCANDRPGYRALGPGLETMGRRAPAGDLRRAPWRR